MQRIDRAVGVFLVLLASAVLWTARAFPSVPGQKVGAGFLPMIVGAGLLVCGLLLVRRGFAGKGSSAAPQDAPDGAPAPPVAPGAEPAATGTPARAPLRAAFVVTAAVGGYIALAERAGFLVVAPLLLVATMRVFGQSWRAAVLWSLVGTVVVHVAFYKLLRVPLPWGWLRPFY